MQNNSYNIVVCVTGGIAAYKAPEVVRSFQKKGHDVRVVMTENAGQFIGKKTFEALTGYPVLEDLFGINPDSIRHTSLAKWADATVVVPATANILAKASHGIADDAMTSYLLATYTPRVFAPAMNTHMLENPATQNNIKTLISYGDKIVSPDWGELACGDLGKGHLADIETIVQTTLDTLKPTKQDLKGKKVLITAGPTREYFDPVRYISNPSTGKMGLCLAEAAQKRGADVQVILGPVPYADVNPAINIENVVSADDMYEATMRHFDSSDIVICTAAVCDFKPEITSDKKIKKSDNSSVKDIRFVENKDILADISSMNQKHKDVKCVVGFAAETDNVCKNAQDKFSRKGCDLLVVNDVSNQESTFGSDTNKVSIISNRQLEDIDLMTKRDLSDVILSRALVNLDSKIQL